MRERFRGYGLTDEEVRTLIGGILHANDGLYAGVRVRCVAIKTDHGWENGLLFAQAVSKDVLIEKATSLRYERVRLLETWLDVPGLPTLLGQIAGGAADIDGDAVTFRVNRKFGEYEFRPGLNEYSDFPGYVFQSERVERVPVPMDPLLAYGLPFHSDAFSAMRDWLGMGDLRDVSDSRVGTSILFLPEGRARFSGFRWVDDALHMSVVREGGTVERLRAKGAFEAGGTRGRFDVPVEDTGSRVDMPATPDALEIYLIGPDETVYDFRHETPYLAVSRTRVLGAPVPADGDEVALRAALAHGEGDQVEFKPFVKRGDGKLDEIVNTVIAFANSRGGAVYLGVNDHCVPIGIEREIEKMQRNDGRAREEALEEYVGWLKQEIGGALNKTVPFTVRPLVVDAHTLVVIQVPEGERKAYCHRDRKIVYVRRGASNMVADPDRDLPQLLRSADSRIGGLWRRGA